MNSKLAEGVWSHPRDSPTQDADSPQQESFVRQGRPVPVHFSLEMNHQRLQHIKYSEKEASSSSSFQKVCSNPARKVKLKEKFKFPSFRLPH